MIGPAGFQQTAKPQTNHPSSPELMLSLKPIQYVGRPTLDEYEQIYDACIGCGMTTNKGRPIAGETRVLPFIQTTLGVSKATITRLERERKSRKGN